VTGARGKRGEEERAVGVAPKETEKLRCEREAEKGFSARHKEMLAEQNEKEKKSGTQLAGKPERPKKECRGRVVLQRKGSLPRKHNKGPRKSDERNQAETRGGEAEVAFSGNDIYLEGRVHANQGRGKYR